MAEATDGVDKPHVDVEYENLALEGGGAKGIAYVGALKVFGCIS